MPEFTVKEVRLPELHLPEIKREEIVRTLSGVRIPDVDLSRVRATRLRLPTVALTSSDLGRLIATGAALARFVQPTRRGRMPTLRIGRRSRAPLVRLVQPRPRRSRWPLVAVMLGAIALAAWALLRRPAVRRRVDDAAREARERLVTMRPQEDRLEIETDAPSPPRVLETAADGEGDGIPAFEEAARGV